MLITKGLDVSHETLFLERNCFTDKKINQHVLWKLFKQENRWKQYYSLIQIGIYTTSVLLMLNFCKSRDGVLFLYHLKANMPKNSGKPGTGIFRLNSHEKASTRWKKMKRFTASNAFMKQRNPTSFIISRSNVLFTAPLPLKDWELEP